MTAGVVSSADPRPSVDPRRPDWPVRNQGTTGACVGFAAADGVLHWHYRQASLLPPGERPSPRFIWMANKESDRLTSYPTTFIESAGTQTKLPAHRPPLRLRPGKHATHDRQAEFPEHGGVLYQGGPDTGRGGHAICLVGYTVGCFIVRNS